MTTDISKASGNRFQLIFPILPEEDSIYAHKQFSLNIVDTPVPGFSLVRSEKAYKGGTTYRESGFDVFNPGETNFIIDSSGSAGIIISDGMFNINNNRDIFGKENLEDYQCDAQLLILDNYDDISMKLKFENIWPFELGDVQQSYEEGEEELKCPVTFSYDRYYRITGK